MTVIRIIFWAALGLWALTAAAVEHREVGNLVIEDIPEIPAQLSEQLNRYRNTRDARFQGWLATGGVLITTRFGETTQIHAVDAPGAARRQLTFFEEPVLGADPNPTGPTMLFTRDVGGGEFYQVFLQHLETGVYQLLTDGKSRNGSVLWSNAGGRFAYYTTRRNGRDWDIHIMSPLTTPANNQAVLEEQGTWVPVDWARDDDRLLVLNYVSVNESYPYVLNLRDGSRIALHDSDLPIAYNSLAFAGDGQGIYYTSDEDSDFQRLRYYDLDAGTDTVVRGQIGWDIEELAVSRDGDQAAFTVNAGGMSELHLMDLRLKRDVEIQALPTGVASNLRFSEDGKHLGMTVNSATGPADIYVLDVADRSLTRWTTSEVGGLNTDNFVAPVLVEYPSFDGRMIPAFYYQAPGAGAHPVVIDIHGGPESQERPTFSPLIQYLVCEMDVSVLAPNVRGSDGYGKGYLRLDNGKLREDSVKDIGALIDWIGAQPELDSSRVAVLGGSYGGYMSLAAMTHYSDRLRAGVDLVGISNFVTFLTNTQDYRRALRRVEYGDESDPDMRAFLTGISPLSNADKITKPLFVIAGQNDPRVPASESEQIVNLVRKNGVEVWSLLARDEGHGFRKKDNRDYMYNAIALFLERHLLAPVEPPAAETPAEHAGS